VGAGDGCVVTVRVRAEEEVGEEESADKWTQLVSEGKGRMAVAIACRGLGRPKKRTRGREGREG
jgi:hypothetical protein